VIKLILADDHLLVREGLKRLIMDAPDMRVVGEAATSDEAIAIAGSLEADVALLDVTMPGPGIIETITRLQRESPGLRILVLSVQPEDQYARRTFQAGASGYLMKDRTPEELVAAIRQVYAGGRYISPALAEKIAFALGDDTGRAPLERLSAREYQVLGLLASGRAMKEIAGQLSLSPKTVSTYRVRLLEKLELTTTSELIRYAIEKGVEP
jgi:DNA-binding NarL/FixJ family response regulator